MLRGGHHDVRNEQFGGLLCGRLTRVIPFFLFFPPSGPPNSSLLTGLLRLWLRLRLRRRALLHAWKLILCSLRGGIRLLLVAGSACMCKIFLGVSSGRNSAYSGGIFRIVMVGLPLVPRRGYPGL